MSVRMRSVGLSDGQIRALLAAVARAPRTAHPNELRALDNAVRKLRGPTTRAERKGE